MKRKVEFFEKLNDDTIRCKVCPHKCIIKEGYSGLCRVREVKDGILYATNYGEISSLSLDPIEKKPLFHYKPGTNILSLGSYGCNFTCGFCQNYTIAQFKPNTQYVSVEEIVKKAKEYKNQNSIGLAFTYNEPLMFYEYVLDVAKICKKEGLDVVVVTNGFINKEPLEKLLPFVDAMNIDLKAFSDEFYKSECSGKLEDVLSTIKLASKHCHIEITTLLISEHNDTEKEVREIANFISKINKNIPLHLSRYYPNYKFKSEATDINKIKDLADIAREYLNYVYIGNILEVDNNTYCPNCGELLVERNMYDSIDRNLNDTCRSCAKKIYIVNNNK